MEANATTFVVKKDATEARGFRLSVTEGKKWSTLYKNKDAHVC